jgi:hypothetical protein
LGQPVLIRKPVVPAAPASTPQKGKRITPHFVSAEIPKKSATDIFFDLVLKGETDIVSKDKTKDFFLSFYNEYLFSFGDDFPKSISTLIVFTDTWKIMSKKYTNREYSQAEKELYEVQVIFSDRIGYYVAFEVKYAKEVVHINFTKLEKYQ